MTTEILRNNLYLIYHGYSELDFNVNIAEEVSCIVFDEVHYINDKDRAHLGRMFYNGSEIMSVTNAFCYN